MFILDEFIQSLHEDKDVHFGRKYICMYVFKKNSDLFSLKRRNTSSFVCFPLFQENSRRSR